VFAKVWTFLGKEFLVEWRERYALSGILLYLLSTIFIVYFSFKLKLNHLNSTVWNALYWIIILFVGINAVAKSFMQESQHKVLYYYTIISPLHIIISRMLYNFALMLGLSLLGLLVFILVVGNPVLTYELFLLNVFLGVTALSVTFTLVSGIASKGQNKSTLMAVLGFPLIIPILLLCVKVSDSAMLGMSITGSGDELLSLLAINLISISMTLILFPYLWRN